MQAKILSLNIGEPKVMEWNGRSIQSSMHKLPVAGPLVVHKDHIENNSFSSPQFHGGLHAILYIYGMTSAQKFIDLLNIKEYQPGMTGETLTVDHFDETQISVGDIFQIGEVKAQATYPRIPCGKVNFRMQHADGQKAMQDCGLSGVYLRILTPGKINITDEVKRIEQAKTTYLISEVYQTVIHKLQPDIGRVKMNGAFPPEIVEKWTKAK